MASIVTTYDKQGTRLEFLNVKTIRSWSLNDEQNAGLGTCSFQIATSDPKCNRAVLEFGNLLLVEDEDNELPDWVGFIDSVQGREFGRGFVNVNAIAAEQIFNWRILLTTRPLTGTASVIYKQLIEYCNNLAGTSTKVALGRIPAGGRNYLVNPGTSIMDAVKKLSKSSGRDWNITPYIDDENSLTLRANLYDGLKGEKVNVVLNEKNTKVLDPTLIENGEIINYVLFYGDSAGGGIKYAVAQNGNSIGRYGLRATIQKAGGANEDELQSLANEMLAKNLSPKQTLALSVINVGGLFGLMDVGNTYTFESNTYGFMGGSGIGALNEVRAVGMEYDDSTKELSMLVEVL